MTASRRCVFCRGAGLTREHVVPDWLTAILPEQAEWRGHDRAVVVPSADGQSRTVHLPHREVRERFNAMTVKAVCRACNSGWMSELENQAKPAITAMVRGDPRRLGVRDTAAVARWAIKTAIVGHLTGAEVADLASVAAVIKDSPGPPAGTWVWGGPVESDDWALRIETPTALIAEAGEELTIADACNTLMATLGLGRLLLHVLVITRPSLRYPDLHEAFPSMVKLWPPTEASITVWPPGPALSGGMAWEVMQLPLWWFG